MTDYKDDASRENRTGQDAGYENETESIEEPNRHREEEEIREKAQAGDVTTEVTEGTWSTYADAETNASAEVSRESEDVRVRKIIREEIRRNYRPKLGWGRVLAFILAGALLGSAITGAFFKSGLLGGIGDSAQGTHQSVDIKLDSESTVENAVAAKSTQSIVGITTKTPSAGYGNPFLQGIPQYSESVGTGIIVDSNGYILTNSHVVENGKASQVVVRFADGSEIDAQLVWNDTSLDLAMIKVEKTGLPAIELGDSDRVQVGDKAVAIGNPLGLDLQSTLTSGYVSGLNRTIQLQNGGIMDGLIQTDAAINAGNSGGALLNAKGQVIGINTARPQSADGIGFAIPINVAKPIIEKVIATGSYQPLYLGITGMNVQAALQYGAQNLPTDKGALINQVFADSPAAKAGFTQGDIITAIDGKPVDSMNGLKTHLLEYAVGDTVEITYFRDGKEQKTKLTFTDFAPSTAAQNEESQENEEPQGRFPFLP